MDENIDQMFMLDKSLEELLAAYTLNVNVRKLESVFDVKRWVEGELHRLSRHIHQHNFKITKDELVKAVIYKIYSLHLRNGCPKVEYV